MLRMMAVKVNIEWHPGISIFASESFLKAVGDDYGWVGGVDSSGKLRCILPYTIIRKSFLRMLRFRVETIPVGEELAVVEEGSFLNSAMKHFKSIDVDTVIPATTNTIFRTYPDGATAAPYGSYIVDLCQTEEILWQNVERITRQNIKSASRKGVTISSGMEHFDVAYALTRDTFARSKLPFMSYDALKRYVAGLGEYGKIIVAEYQGVAQSSVIYGFSEYCAYAVYGGNLPKQVSGANKLLHWEAIRLFRGMGTRQYDFVGARIHPEKGSKQEGISRLKKHLGGRLREGYMWKFPLRPLKSLGYSVAVRLLRGGDIVDHERHKLKAPNSE